LEKLVNPATLIEALQVTAAPAVLAGSVSEDEIEVLACDPDTGDLMEVAGVRWEERDGHRMLVIELGDRP
jgi:hypothetical protein